MRRGRQKDDMSDALELQAFGVPRASPGPYDNCRNSLKPQRPVMMSPIPPIRMRFLVFTLLAGSLPLLAPSARAGLQEYVKTPDPSFSWKIKSKTELPQGTVHELHLVSQTWQGITWEHALQVCVPKNVTPGKTLFLWNQGGRPNVG